MTQVVSSPVTVAPHIDAFTNIIVTPKEYEPPKIKPYTPKNPTLRIPIWKRPTPTLKKEKQTEVNIRKKLKTSQP